MKKGKLIVFEGIDGAGSTTQLKLFGKYLKKKKLKFVETHEPTDGLIGKLISKALRREVKFSWDTLQLLYSADRADHLDKLIKPNLDRGVNVISDRYFLSTFAYGQLNLEGAWLRKLNSKFQPADITFYIDTPAKVAIGRIEKTRSQSELFEKEKLLEIVRKNYLKIVKEYSKSTYVLDGTRRVEEIAGQVIQIFEKYD
jgi:dTMP kinase